MTIYHPVSGALTVPPDGFAICNSRGRRVSLLNDDNSPYIPRHEQRSTPQPCPSPSMKFNSEPPSEVPYSSNVYSAPSPHTVMSAYDSTSPQLPHVHDLISFTFPNYDSQEENRSRNSSISSVSKYSRRDSMASSGSRQTSRDNSAQYKPSKRRYECTTCGKTFTTSGHVARHNRIHTGEKNFQCPEPGCSQRFSRQDNCMQHYRTHKSHTQVEIFRSPAWGSTSSRSHRNKRKRTKTDSTNISIDPNDRLSAFAAYISVYA